ncbi:MAG: hypothetical protein J6D06_01315 [Clostridia bacterium]|nr:hypothetical protein [Clostridia bacterium]
MKKVSLVLALVLLLTTFVGCGDKTEVESTTQTVSETAEDVVTISVNKSLVADETEFLTDISEFEGVSVSNDDNFYVLTMSQDTYVAFLKIKAQLVYDSFNDIVEKGSFVEKIEHGEDFRTIKVFVNRTGFDAIGKETQRLQLITIGAYAMSYQMFLTEGQKTTVTAVYSDTNEEAMLITLPITV